jgi:hypothetical protein
MNQETEQCHWQGAELTKVGDATGHRRDGEARAIQRRPPLHQLVMASAFQQIVLKLVCLVVKKKGEIYSEN